MRNPTTATLRLFDSLKPLRVERRIWGLGLQHYCSPNGTFAGKGVQAETAQVRVRRRRGRGLSGAAHPSADLVNISLARLPHPRFDNLCCLRLRRLAKDTTGGFFHATIT